MGVASISVEFADLFDGMKSLAGDDRLLGSECLHGIDHGGAPGWEVRGCEATNEQQQGD